MCAGYGEVLRFMHYHSLDRKLVKFWMTENLSINNGTGNNNNYWQLLTIIANDWQLLTWISTVAVFSAHLMRAHDRGASMPVSIVIFLFLWFTDIVTILMSAPWNKSLSKKLCNMIIKMINDFQVTIYLHQKTF